MNVVIIGYGAMGERLVSRIGVTEGLSLVGVIDTQKNFGLNSYAELSVIPDVIIDFSHPSNLKEMLEYAKQNIVGLLIATTGYSEADIKLIEAASSVIPIVKTSNTSLGINLLIEVLKQITPVLTGFDVEIIEKHHNKKVDSPSGTANMLVDQIIASSSIDKVVHGREGHTVRTMNEIGVHAVRGGTIPGEHTVVFAGNDEIIEIKHTALSKEVFVTGALKAINFIENKEQGLFTMIDVLFNKE